jgi:hypothetical protein
VSRADLDAWEARPLTLRHAEDVRALRDAAVDKTVKETEDVTLSAHR